MRRNNIAMTGIGTTASSLLLLILAFATHCESFQLQWMGGGADRRRMRRVASSRTASVDVADRRVGGRDASRRPSSSSSSDLATVADFDEMLDAEIRGALRSAEIDLASSGRSGGNVDVGARTTPSSSSLYLSSLSAVKARDDAAANALLMEAQREAYEAEAMLRRAEEDVSKWERELAHLEREEGIATNIASAANDAGGANPSSMADAYKSALDAANDIVEILSAQILELEGELEDAMTRMQRNVEERERIGADYANLAENYDDTKRRYEEEGGCRGGGGVTASGDDATDAATMRESIDVLNEEIESYKSLIVEAGTRLGDMETPLSEARNEAEMWRNMHDDALSRMETPSSGADEVERAGEKRTEAGESYELRVFEATANLEGERRTRPNVREAVNSRTFEFRHRKSIY